MKLDKERRRVERKRRKERREKGLELKTTRQTKNPKDTKKSIFSDNNQQINIDKLFTSGETKIIKQSAKELETNVFKAFK